MTDKQPTKTVKRQVKSPETFRERAIKATTELEKPKRQHSLRKYISKTIGPIFQVIANTWKKIFSVQPFKTIALIGIFVGKIIFPVYFRRSWRELRLVKWPNWQESRQLTFAVLAFAVVFGAAIAGVDYGLDKLFKHILLK